MKEARYLRYDPMFMKFGNIQQESGRWMPEDGVWSVCGGADCDRTLRTLWMRCNVLHFQEVFVSWMCRKCLHTHSPMRVRE
jgi:hypothetical protein